IEAIFSAADSGFNGSFDIPILTSPAAYMGTITGCFLLPALYKLTIFRVSIPKEHKSFLLLWEPPHWYLRPYASWISCSSVHTSSTTHQFSPKVSLVLICVLLASSKCSKEVTPSLVSGTGKEGKQASNIRSRRFSNAICIKTKFPYPPKNYFNFSKSIYLSWGGEGKRERERVFPCNGTDGNRERRNTVKWEGRWGRDDTQFSAQEISNDRNIIPNHVSKKQQ
uniref:Uncharacterized protein n=1 Tax=Monodelphis domestica TaxID=13616 RepID=A0A5F8GNI6_MONDO